LYENIKAKRVPKCATKVQNWSGVINPLILDLGTNRKRVINLTHESLFPEKSSWFTLHSRLGGPQSRSALSGKDRKPLPLPGSEALIV